jgi:DNA-directed RNA polymerase specialized sigma24 family protein
MPTKRVSMRKIREVLRLAHEHKLSIRQVSRATGIGKSTVGEFVARAIPPLRSALPSGS